MRPQTAAGVAAAVGGYASIYHLGRTWGATRQERAEAVAGDDMVARPTFRTTHAVTIDAPAEAVWPWLVQMGWGRGGWYTYPWVDRLLFPANGPSADVIVPDHQDLAVGDHIPDGPPDSGCYFTVRRLEPARLLVLFSDSHLFGPMADRDEVAMAWAWTWRLTPLPGGRTRLLQRNNGRLTPSWAAALYLATIVPADFVMARSHLLGLKARAEGTTADTAAV